jgi:Zn-finger nucleic acid-binding protein
MQCPKCNAEMGKVTHGSIEVDRCTSCEGIWFDLLERERLERQEGSEQIDTGDGAVGRHFDKVGQIDCPVCGTPMIRMVDAEQPHVRYESCTTCNGIFLDAGEFRDLKGRTLLDFVRDLLAPERT